ncbi:MAG: RNA polymerase subunit sigma-70, partial [Clostridia bacterium]|nr:RNA polymerase subunit sigma-70 [Clostridia bacterium]
MFGLLSLLLGKIMFFTGAVFEKTSFKKPLDKDEEVKYVKLAQKGDKNARSVLVEHNMRLVAHVVKKYKGAAETDDLISVGSMGLAKAITTYDADKGTSLATFAARCIENEILMLIRANKKH